MRETLVKRALVVVATMVVVVGFSPLMSIVAPAGAASPAAASTGSTAAVKATPSAVHPATVPTTPHPGYLVVDVVNPNGATTVDPAVAYDTASYEPILNSYETLIAYNSASTATFAPVLSTCVPGTIQCITDYGSNLVGVSGGKAVYYTFPIDPLAQFYDPSTHVSWPVYPSDVVFSLARTMAYTDLPYVAAQPGWIQSQALLPGTHSTGILAPNIGWDGGIHWPFNNTPSNVMSSMLVNDSRFCPSIAISNGHGCVTFIADGNDSAWGYFLNLIVDGLGASVTPCSWVGVQGNRTDYLPGFVPTNNVTGDGPCLLPGAAHSTSDAGFQSWLTNGATGGNPHFWDTYEQVASGLPYDEPLNTTILGSGPYTASVSLFTGYTLRDNPSYTQPVGCAGGVVNGVTYAPFGGVGCYPAPGSYVPQVNVSYDQTDVNSTAGFAAGTIDFGGIQANNITTELDPLIAAGNVTVTNAASPTVRTFQMNMNWSSTNYATDFPTQPVPNIPADFFSGQAVRSLFQTAFPYQKVLSSIFSTGTNYSGSCPTCVIHLGSGFGGPIPSGWSTYPGNVSFPFNHTGTPDNNSAHVGSAAWWFAQGQNVSSPYYDAELAACTPGTPCTVDMVGRVSSGTYNPALLLWMNSLRNITGGAIQPFTFNVTFHQLLLYTLYAPPATNPLGVWPAAWAMDYPDPTDYVNIFAAPDNSYTAPNAWAEQFAQPQYNNPSCGHATPNAANLSYWAYSVAQIPQVCQGVAYHVAGTYILTAGPLPAGATRTYYYNAVEHILNALAGTVWVDQEDTNFFTAPWIDTATLNLNAAIGAGGDTNYFMVRYVGQSVGGGSLTVSFKEKGLPVGAVWNVTASTGQTGTNTTMIAGTGSTGIVPIATNAGELGFTIANQTIGPTTYSVAKITGPGNPSQTSGLVSANVTWTVFFGAVEKLYFNESALPQFQMYAGAFWSVALTPALSHGGPAPLFGSTIGNSISFSVPAGAAYKFIVSAPGEYKVLPPKGGVHIPVGSFTKTVKFKLSTAVVVFKASGYPSTGRNWSVSLTGTWAGDVAAPAFSLTLTTTGGAIKFKLAAGSYNYTVTNLGANALAPHPATGSFSVTVPSAAQTITITWA